MKVVELPSFTLSEDDPPALATIMQSVAKKDVYNRKRKIVP